MPNTSSILLGVLVWFVLTAVLAKVWQIDRATKATTWKRSFWEVFRWEIVLGVGLVTVMFFAAVTRGLPTR